MVTSSDTESGDVVVDDTPDQGVSVVRSGEHSVDGKGGSDGDGQERDPLDVVNQVSPSDGRQVLLLGNSS